MTNAISIEKQILDTDPSLKVWEKDGKRRIYFNTEKQLEIFFGFIIGYYNTGNISYAELDGEKISNSRAKKINHSIYYDCVAQKYIGELAPYAKITQ